MTREEAIKQLKKCKSFHNGSYGEALEMAIKALEQQSCEYKPLIIDKPKDEDMQELLRIFQNQKVLVAEHDCLPSVTLLAEPCDDCISRQAVLEKAIIVPIAKVVTEDKVICRKVVFVEDIQKLPSVTPKTDVLDKIKVEIDLKQYNFMDNKDYDEGIRFGLMLAYQIIDKYKAESEDKE